MLLDDIVNVPKIESFHFECKARLNRENAESWLKTIAGFSNASGGAMFIGVEDKSNKLIGFTRQEADNERNFFNNQINEHIFPRPAFKISFIQYENNGKELFVIRVDVSESPVKPIIVKFKNVPSIYMRREGFTNGATYEEIINMSIKSHAVQYDMTDSDRMYVRSDFSKMMDFFTAHNPASTLSDKALQSLGFFSNDKTLKKGAELFADDYDGEKTHVQCSVFGGFNKGSERIITINRFKGCLTDSISYMMDFVRQRMNHSVIKLADSRLNIDAYPERALFEGIVNAVAHRDYFLDGTQIQLDMFKDRLEISSPGSFYQGDVSGRTYDLSNIISKRRNELICGILVKCNVMEAAGTGFDKIIQDYESADELHKPFINAASDHFTLVLPDLTFASGIKDDALPEIEFIPVSGGSEHDEKILSFCYTGARKSSEIAGFVGLSDSSYFRKNILENLVRQGYLIKEKVSGVSFYRTSPQNVRKL